MQYFTLCQEENNELFCYILDLVICQAETHGHILCFCDQMQIFLNLNQAKNKLLCYI
jgi:hypothetical protein